MSSGRSSQAVDFVAQLRLRIDPEDGRLQKYLRWWHGSSRLKVGDRALAEAIRGRERFLTVKQAGIEDPLEVDPGSPIELLEVSLSSEMLDELRRAGYSNHPLHKTPSLVRLRVDGPATPEPGR
ncbi:MAG: hypothetical protein SFX72_08860 [Isosphaeraceae bacterium]|nr:hypothetical protein [Isosphaeraceae bacterium]